MPVIDRHGVEGPSSVPPQLRSVFLGEAEGLHSWKASMLPLLCKDAVTMAASRISGRKGSILAPEGGPTSTGVVDGRLMSLSRLPFQPCSTNRNQMVDTGYPVILYLVYCCLLLYTYYCTKYDNTCIRLVQQQHSLLQTTLS